MRFPALKASSTRTWRGGTGTAGPRPCWGGGGAAPLEAALGAGAVAASRVAQRGQQVGLAREVALSLQSLLGIGKLIDHLLDGHQAAGDMRVSRHVDRAHAATA